MGKMHGFSFSWKRATGISAAKGKISRKIGIPLTKSGRQRKAGKAMGCCIPFALFLGLLFTWSALAHPGRTDANGGHNDRKNGGYHYHNGGNSGGGGGNSSSSGGFGGSGNSGGIGGSGSSGFSRGSSTSNVVEESRQQQYVSPPYIRTGPPVAKGGWADSKENSTPQLYTDEDSPPYRPPGDTKVFRTDKISEFHWQRDCSLFIKEGLKTLSLVEAKNLGLIECGLCHAVPPPEVQKNGTPESKTTGILSQKHRWKIKKTPYNWRK